MSADASEWIGVLRDSHDWLFGHVTGFEPADLQTPSYCADWTVSDVLSHIGSGAEIGKASLLAGLGEREPLDQAGREEIWDRWNAKSPEEQAADSALADEELVSMWEELDDDRLTSIKVPFAGMDLSAVDVLALRLSEHAVHTWDVLVAFEPTARVRPVAVNLLIDRLPVVVPWFSKAGGVAGESVIDVHTSEPERSFVLRAGESVSLEASAQAGGATSVDLPAEALLRLVYGRLDDGHMPAEVSAGEADLDQLRKLFPGF